MIIAATAFTETNKVSPVVDSAVVGLVAAGFKMLKESVVVPVDSL